MDLYYHDPFHLVISITVGYSLNTKGFSCRESRYRYSLELRLCQASLTLTPCNFFRTEAFQACLNVTPCNFGSVWL